MATIRVAELAGVIVVFGEGGGRIIPVGRIFVEQLIYGVQKSFGLIPSGGALAAQSRLEIGHEQSGSDAFASDGRYYQAEPAGAEIKKVVIVSPDGPSGMANPRIEKRS